MKVILIGDLMHAGGKSWHSKRCDKKYDRGEHKVFRAAFRGESQIHVIGYVFTGSVRNQLQSEQRQGVLLERFLEANVPSCFRCSSSLAFFSSGLKVRDQTNFQY